MWNGWIIRSVWKYATSRIYNIKLFCTVANAFCMFMRRRIQSASLYKLAFYVFEAMSCLERNWSRIFVRADNIAKVKINWSKKEKSFSLNRRYGCAICGVHGKCNGEFSLSLSCISIPSINLLRSLEQSFRGEKTEEIRHFAEGVEKLSDSFAPWKLNFEYLYSRKW